MSKIVTVTLNFIVQNHISALKQLNFNGDLIITKKTLFMRHNLFLKKQTNKKKNEYRISYTDTYISVINQYWTIISVNQHSG